jgi:hypothetical protein
MKRQCTGTNSTLKLPHHYELAVSGRKNKTTQNIERKTYDISKQWNGKDKTDSKAKSVMKTVGKMQKEILSNFSQSC